MTKFEKEVKDAIKLHSGKEIDYNQEFEAYGLKLKRKHVVDCDAIEAKPRNAKTLELMEKYPTLKKLVVDAIAWFNEIRILNAVEKHFKSFGIASKKHRELDIDLVNEICKEERACAVQEGLYVPHDIDCCSLILDMCPYYEIVK